MGPASTPPALAVVLPFCVGYYLSYLLRTVNAVIAPELTRALGLDAAALGFLTSTYFLTFAAAQLPVGLALDRYGPRRVVAALLAVAAVGLVLFATGRNFGTLAIGRALVGVGVSASLMGGFRAFADAFPPARQASLTGIIMASGAVGALTASAPLAWALPFAGWRGSLLVVAALTAAAALTIALVVPAPGRRDPGAEGEGDQLGALAQVLRSRPFWTLAPQAALFTGGFMAIQGLWIVPWSMAVDGTSRAAATSALLAVNAGVLAGQLGIAAGATRLARAGLDRERLMRLGVGAALVVEAAIVARVIAGPTPWFAFGLCAATNSQVYGVAGGRFPSHLYSRVSTAINLAAFTGAFFLQWGIGIAVDALPTSPERAYRLTFGALWAGQLLSLLWGMRPDRPPLRARAAW